MTEKTRPNWRDYFLDIATLAATRSTCDRAHVGAVLVQDKSVISTGYNGSPPKFPHCDDVGHLMDDGHCVATTHAEINAIAQAAKLGLATEGATCYVTHAPCWPCYKALCSAGIHTVYYKEAYRLSPHVSKASCTARQTGNGVVIYGPDAPCLGCGADSWNPDSNCGAVCPVLEKFAALMWAK